IYTLFYLMIPRTTRTTLFPYTTLFRSNQGHSVSRFVNILSVLEIYHSRKFNSKISLKEKIKDLISQFTAINDKHFNFSDEFVDRSEEHTSELQSRENLVCRLLLEKKKT